MGSDCVLSEGTCEIPGYGEARSWRRGSTILSWLDILRWLFRWATLASNIDLALQIRAQSRAVLYDLFLCIDALWVFFSFVQVELSSHG